MRKILCLISTFVILIVLQGCSNQKYPQALLEADSIMADQPDSAIKILKKAEPQINSSSDKIKHYYRFLWIKANDKSNNGHIKSDDIKELVNYYEDNEDDDLLPEVYYYAGRSCCNYHEAPIAMTYLQKALDLIENSPDKILLRFCIHSQMGFLYLFQNLDKESEQHFKTAYDIAKEINNPCESFWAARNLGNAYLWQGRHNDSYIYLNEAQKIASKSHKSLFLAQISSDLASLHNTIGDYAGAMSYIKTALDNIELLDEGTVLNLESDILFNSGQIQLFLQQSKKVELCASVLTKEKLYDRLIEHYIENKDVGKIQQYYKKYKLCNDSIMSLIRESESHKIKFAYDMREYEIKEYGNVQKHKYIRDFFILLFMFATAALFTYMRSYHRRTKERLKRFKILYREVQLQRDDNKVINLCPQSVIKSSSIYSSVLSKAQSGEKLNDEDWKQVESIVLEVYPDFKNRLLDVYEFSLHEYHLCLLVKMDMPPTYMAVLTARSTSAISHARRRLCEKSFGKSGTAEHWDEFIRSL